MKYEKIINIFVEEEPIGPQAGDLLFLKYQDSSVMNPKKSDKYWSVHRYNNTPTGGYWQALSRHTHLNAIKWQFGIDLEGK